MQDTTSHQPFKYLSVCSGIEAASVAWEPLGWECAGVSEIEAFPNAVLQYRYPSVKNFGDFTTIGANDVGAIDLLMGGTPCQDFSVAGKRAGMDGERGNLTLEFLQLLNRARPRWMVWENVPGVLSSNGGRDFGAFLGGLGERGYGWAYRVLDAQYFGVPQRRRRVFVVGYLGDAARAAAVLFERESLCGHPAPRREAGAIAAALTRNGVGGGGGPDDNAAQANHLIAFQTRGSNIDANGAIAGTIGTNADCASGGAPMVAFTSKDYGADAAVRRLTPRECERLQGFPDDFTLVPYRGKPAADGPRYRAIGNSMAVPVMKWIGERIQMVNSL
jgi:DNA (cytosine-5)-methyltransferase 1